jgi:hypothetical protein
MRIINDMQDALNFGGCILISVETRLMLDSSMSENLEKRRVE